MWRQEEKETDCFDWFFIVKPSSITRETNGEKSLFAITIIALSHYWAQAVEQWLSVRVGRVQIQGLTFGSDCQYALA